MNAVCPNLVGISKNLLRGQPMHLRFSLYTWCVQNFFAMPVDLVGFGGRIHFLEREYVPKKGVYCTLICPFRIAGSIASHSTVSKIHPICVPLVLPFNRY